MNKHVARITVYAEAKLRGYSSVCTYLHFLRLFITSVSTFIHGRFKRFGLTRNLSQRFMNCLYTLRQVTDLLNDLIEPTINAIQSARHVIKLLPLRRNCCGVHNLLRFHFGLLPVSWTSS